MAVGIGYMREATVIDPGFVDAWVRLGDMYAFAGSHLGFMPPEEANAATRDALLRAVTLDPGNAMAQASLGDHYACVQADLELAGKAFDRALAADPDIRHHGITRYLALTSGRDEAFAYIEETLAIYPDSPWEMFAASGHYSGFRASERALELSRQILEIWPDHDRARVTMASSLAKLGRVDEGLAIMQPMADDEGAPPRTRLIYAMMLARAGDLDRAREIVGAVRASSRRVAESHLAMTYGWLGDHDEAIRWLRLADEKGEFGLCYLPFEPFWDPLREDPRFAEILAARYPGLVD
jgi:serine/threonine-protein kinase